MSRTRQKVQLANQEDEVNNIRAKFRSLTNVLDAEMTGSSRRTCIEFLEAQLGQTLNK